MLFNLTIDRDEDGDSVIECPSISGCVSQGDTREEAIENIKDAIKLCLEVRAELGMPMMVETARVEVPFEYPPNLMALLEERSRPGPSDTMEQVRKVLDLE